MNRPRRLPPPSGRWPATLRWILTCWWMQRARLDPH
jgi:hypothetical protein